MGIANTEKAPGDHSGVEFPFGSHTPSPGTFMVLGQIVITKLFVITHKQLYIVSKNIQTKQGRR
jgi:hypothetical protein